VETDVSLVDHIGWDLWQAGQVWKNQFAARMVTGGHGCFAQARSVLIPHIDRDGIRQSELVQRAGLTKQAVQQFIDELASDDIVYRVPDPADARGKLVRFTEKGLHLLADASVIKAELELGYVTLLGAAEFNTLRSSLKRIASLACPALT
jgi:DNA-binding MarR family transcriptional regulator